MTAYKDEKTNTWYCQFWYKDWTGKNRHKVKRGFKLKRDAEQWEQAFKNENNICPDITMDELFIQYENHLYNLETLGTYRKSTVVFKLDAIKYYIRPYFTGVIANKITTKDINDWVVKLKTKTNKRKNTATLASATVNSRRTVLKQIFEFAMTNYNFKNNPVEKAEKAKYYSSDDRAKYWTLEQYNAFYNALNNEQYRIIFNLMFYSGMRIGEALALTPSSFLPYNISVEHNFRRMKYKGEIINHIGPPKNKPSERGIKIPHFLYNQITDYISRIYDIDEDDRIINYAYATIYNKMMSTIQKVGLPRISPHILRHSYANILRDCTNDIAVVSKQLGHSNPKTTLAIYTHMLPQKDDNAVEELEKRIIKSSNFEDVDFLNSN